MQELDFESIKKKVRVLQGASTTQQMSELETETPVQFGEKPKIEQIRACPGLSIVGIKVRLSHDIVGKNDIEAFERALAVAKEINKPLMIHIGGTYNTLEQGLERK